MVSLIFLKIYRIKRNTYQHTFLSFALLFILLISGSCKRDDDIKILADTDILLLKIDYTTSSFEGGIIYSFKSPLTDSIPLLMEYKPPGDFGHIKLIYVHNDSVLFWGRIHWAGKGEIEIPAYFIPPDNFELKNNSLQPMARDEIRLFLDERLKLLNDLFNRIDDKLDEDYENLWESVSHLEIVHDYVNSGALVGLVVYTPTDGPINWDVAKWLLILYKQQ